MSPPQASDSLPRRSILIIDDEESLRYTFAAFLGDAGYAVTTAAARDTALASLGGAPPDLVFLDILLGRDDGIELLGEIRRRFPDLPVVMITGAPQVDTAAEAVRFGAFDYIAKPIRQETLLRIARQALQHGEVVRQRERYRAHLEAIFRSVRDGILLVDRDLVILEGNAAAADLANETRGLRGLPLALLTPELAAPLMALARATLAAAPAGSDRLQLESGGRFQVLKLAAAPWAEGRQPPQGVVITLQDETRLEHLERGLKSRGNFEHIIGRSEPMQQVYELIENLAEVDTTVLITGESGTGKELVADALHCRSPRRNGPMVKVNCAALPENLLESELFGHVRGSFTGALRDKVGRFQLAHHGTLFLDEIGDISPALQVRLLRVLQVKEIERVGGNQPIPVDVRIVAATHCNLLEKVRRGEFREDLYYRLRVVEIALPPLRERRGDIPLLVEHFIGCCNARFGRHITAPAPEALARLSAHAWPGNIRELEHAIEHAFVVSRGNEILIRHLPRELQAVPAVTIVPPAGDDEAACIVAALARAAGNKARAARLLGISRRTIYRKIEEYGIDPSPETT